MSGIEEIEDLLKKHIAENKVILDIKIENLVAPGENYGGELSKLEVILIDQGGTGEKFHAVAKRIPIHEFGQKIFNVQETFKGEITFYQKIVPILQEFQRKHGICEVIDFFPKFYGARINLDESSEVVDRNGVILLENLVMSGFANLDRHIGYDLDSAELLLKDLAALHAVPLAIKLKDPNLFQEQIRPYCVLSIKNDNVDGTKFLSTIIQDILWESDKCSPLIQKVKQVLEAENTENEIREPFATFSHGDLWVNNAMMKFVNGKPVENKFVDFQVYNYGSPAYDLLFFLFTSVRLDVLKKELNNLIKHYHSHFIKNLKQLGCDTTPFEMPQFRRELTIEAKRVFDHILMFLPMVIFGEKNKGMEEPPPEDMFPDLTNTTIRDEIRKNTHFKAKEKIWFTVQAFDRRGWF